MLVLVIGGLWAAVTIYKRSQKQKEAFARKEAEARLKPGAGYIKTVACTVCGTYIPERGASACARKDCPV